MNIKINVQNENVIIPAELIDAACGDELIARIFYNRGYKDAGTVRQMLNEDLYKPTCTDEFPHMEEAIDLVINAIEKNELIAVYGDYDVDGVTSTATLVQCLRTFTDKVLYHVPDRFTEGYGMNGDVIKGMGEKGVSLIITCDCGISNFNEIEQAKLLGMGVIITDHHNIPDSLPAADYILNPKLLPEGHRARNLSGCGMAYFLCVALLRRYNREQEAEKLMDLLALSLVADVVSLNGENRYLLKRGLPILFNTERVGLKALFSIIEQTSKLQSEEDIAFQIAPRINAAGRMESARLPVELFLAYDEQESLEMAGEIDYLNKERKRVQQDIINQAIEQVENKKKNKTALVLFNEHWHHGIVGIAAGKICETYRKPAILLSLKEDGTTVVGSARSVEDINIYELIKECSHRLLKFGGHSQAAGLSLKREDVEAFTSEIEKLAESKYFIKDTMQLDVDAELELDIIDQDLYTRLSSAGPYGEGFEPPVFYTKNVSVANDRKTEKNHHIMVLSGKNDSTMAAVKWFGANANLQDKSYDITYKLGINMYRGNSSLQLTIDYLVDASGKSVRSFAGSFLEERGSTLEKVKNTYKSAELFYEGLLINCPDKSAVNRQQIKKSKNLVLLSTPVNTQVLREIIFLANPENIIINFSTNPDYSLKGFLINLMGVVKHIVSAEAGIISIESISSILCVEEGIIMAALKYLQALGKVQFYQDMEKYAVWLYKPESGSAINERAVKMYESNLRAALAEKTAYQQFLLKLEIEKFKEYLK